MLLNLVDQNLLVPDAKDDCPYKGSTLGFVRNLSIKARGAVYENIVQSIMENKNCSVTKSPTPDYDRIIDGKRVEIKGATLCKSSGYTKFVFNQIRPDYEYDTLLFAMFYPEKIVFAEMSKQQVKLLCSDGVFKKQHGGKRKSTTTFTYTGNPESLLHLGATVTYK